jgi:hypothetical protein
MKEKEVKKNKTVQFITLFMMPIFVLCFIMYVLFVIKMNEFQIRALNRFELYKYTNDMLYSYRVVRDSRNINNVETLSGKDYVFYYYDYNEETQIGKFYVKWDKKNYLLPEEIKDTTEVFTIDVKNNQWTKLEWNYIEEEFKTKKAHNYVEQSYLYIDNIYTNREVVMVDKKFNKKMNTYKIKYKKNRQVIHFFLFMGINSYGIDFESSEEFGIITPVLNSVFYVKPNFIRTESVMLFNGDKYKTEVYNFLGGNDVVSKSMEVLSRRIVVYVDPITRIMIKYRTDISGETWYLNKFEVLKYEETNNTK